MKRARLALLVAALFLGALAAALPATAAPVPSLDIQTLPKHYQQTGYPHPLLGASGDYVMHGIYDGEVFDGHSHISVVRSSDGAVVWSDFEPSADAKATSLVGDYFVEKIGDSTYWPESVRFRNVETHVTAGEITVPDNETLAAIGPGWLLTTRRGGSPIPGSFLVIRRLDGSVTELPDVPVDDIPRYSGNEGNIAWVHDGYSGPLFRIDVTAGTATVVPKPDGINWDSVVVGTTSYFNVHDNNTGHITVTEIDRATNAPTTIDLVTGLSGNPPAIFARGEGLGVYQQTGSIEGKYWSVDLADGTLGTLLSQHLSDARSMGGGKVALSVSAQAPGTIAVDDGSGPADVANFPPVAESTGTIAFDGSLLATWGDRTTWSIDPDAASPSWTPTEWTKYQRVTTSGGVTVVNDLDSDFNPTDQWHLSWPGGHRDITAWSLVLGHGGELLVRPVTGNGAGYQVERVRTGQVVATAGQRGAYVDGSWVWTWSAANEVQGEDVDHPETPIRTVPASVTGGSTTAAIVEVRGRWVLVARAGYTVIDTLGVVAPYVLAGANNYTDGSPSRPVLGDGFAVWGRWTYDAHNHVNGSLTTVSDLSPAHHNRELVDPDTGIAPTHYVVDEAGTAAFTYLDHSSRPRVVRLPWLQQAPTEADTTAPTLTQADAPGALVGSTVAVPTHFGWTFADSGTGIASYTVRHRIRTVPAAFGGWTTNSTASAASVDVALDPGQQVCAQAAATDVAGNVSAWTPESCSRVDGAVPVLGATSGSARFTVPDGKGGVTYSYKATDDSGVSSYDVQTRSASYGGGLGSWVALRTATTLTSVSKVTTPGSEWCFRFRARDLAGNVSGWSAGRCSSLAIENKLLARSAKTSLLASARAGDKSITQLNATNASVQTRRSVTGRTLAIWAIAGPTRGQVAVYVGGVKRTTLSTRAPTVQRKMFTVSTTRAGVVKLVRVGTRSVAVDAIAAER